MKLRSVVLLVELMAITTYGVIPSLDENFDGYDNGATFFVAVSNWQASSTSAYVTNSGAYSGKALFMAGNVALSNTLNADDSLTVWTHLRVTPMLGGEEAYPATNSSSFFCYFNQDGYLAVYTPAGVNICSNDVWGGSVEPATNGYVQLSIWQNFNTRTQAVFLRDQLILQDLGFVGPPVSASQLVMQNTDSNCWLDTVWVKTNFNPDESEIVLDHNNNGWVDADELNAFGYVARRLYVSSSATNLVPYFPTLTSALAAWRPHDMIHVISGTYSAEAIVLASSPGTVVFEGDGFAVASLTVASGASASFAQAVTCSGSLTVSGQLAMVQSTTLMSGSAAVAGRVELASNATFTVGGTLTVYPAGLLDFTNNAHFVASTAGVEMNGTFAISNTWTLAQSELVRMPLPFRDDFDDYAANSVVTNLKFRGWSASSDSVKVQTTAHSGRAVILPDGSVLSNSISSTVKKIWTDFQIRPSWGLVSSMPPTNISSFFAYANSNGYLVVAVEGWVVCSNILDAAHSPATPLASNDFTRVTVCQDLNAGTFAVFVAGNLVAQGLNSPAKPAFYASLVAENQDGSAYLDDVLITTLIPDGLGSDLDGDGTPDAYEIHNYGLTTSSATSGTIFKFR